MHRTRDHGADDFSAHGQGLTQRQALGLNLLMDLSDNDLLDLLLSRKEPEGELRTDEVAEVLRLMRRPGP